MIVGVVEVLDGDVGVEPLNVGVDGAFESSTYVTPEAVHDDAFVAASVAFA